MKEKEAVADTSKQYAVDQLSRFDPRLPQLATVMDNRDPTDSGKLKVWIQGSQSDRDAKDSWIECSYAAPFAGRTPGVPGANSYQQYPKGYGFWAVPPDVGVTVIVIFVQGQQFQAYWTGCVYDDRMNTMVPGMATENLPNSGYDMPVPITDYDRNTIQSTLQEKYPNVPTIEGLKKQNLLYDEEKGAANRSSTRTVASTVYGMSTPRGNSFVLDDGYTEADTKKQNWNQDPDGYQDTQVNNPVNDTAIGTRKNEGIVLRTRSGAQIMLSEATGNVFIINRDGTARIEMTADGNIMLHGDKSLNARMGEDISFVAGRSINFQAGADMQWSVAGNTKLNLLGTLDSKIGGQVVINAGADLRLVTAASLRAQAGSSVDIIAGSNLSAKASTTADVMGGSSATLTGGGETLTVKGGGTSSTSQLNAPDFKTPSVGLNDHIHYHAQFTNAESHSDAMRPPVSGGGSSSGVKPVEPQPANDVAPTMPVEEEYEAVQYTNTTQEVTQVTTQDMLYSSDSMSYSQTLEGLYMLMPCTGTIREFGYWGKSVPTSTGTTADRYGWSIQTKGNIVAPDFGTVTKIGTDGVVVSHMSGYKSIFYNIDVSVNNGARVQKGDILGKGTGVVEFEIRKISANLYGFSGTVDPGMFYAAVTGEGVNAANKSLSEGKPSNENAPAIDATTYSENSDELVVLTRVKSIGTGYSQRGSRHVPKRKTSAKRQGVVTDTPVEIGPVDKTAVGWKVVATDEKLVTDTINFEGTIAYQTKRGHFRGGKFWVFPDPVKGQDIGYGHLVTPSERSSGAFNNGITPEQAKEILIKDLQRSVDGAKRLYAQHGLQTAYLCQIVLVEMAYQMGPGALAKFKGMFKALKDGRYDLAAHHIRDSLWYRQTTNRAEIMAKYMEACQ